MNYALETVVRLELESSQGLKVALLRGLIWNLTGIRGHCEEGDFIVKFFNRLLEDIVEHKSAQFDDHFICDVISRNLRNIALLKLAWQTGIGMEKKAHRHSDPHTKPEMQILLKVYRDTELHRRHLGRQIDDRDTDDFARVLYPCNSGIHSYSNFRISGPSGSESQSTCMVFNSIEICHIQSRHIPPAFHPLLRLVPLFLFGYSWLLFVTIRSNAPGKSGLRLAPSIRTLRSTFTILPTLL
ncbi:hypothetical protein C8R43DRAFT_1140887 [Mycena crocata]|nr:hypothetical protein C8R43DRAFT_1140887 [Mycena crocata]